MTTRSEPKPLAHDTQATNRRNARTTIARTAAATDTRAPATCSPIE